MATIQPRLNLPPEFERSLASGELRRDGGVLRRVKDGTIALILKDEAPRKEAEEMVEHIVVKASASTFIKNHKVAVISGGVILIVLIGSGVYLYRRKRKKERALQADTEFRDTKFRDALICYLSAAVAGQLTAEIIEKLIFTLDALDCEGSQNQVQIEFASKDLQNLVKCILGHTSALAAANNYELDTSCDSGRCTIINLRNHLKEQKKIIELVS